MLSLTRCNAANRRSWPERQRTIRGLEGLNALKATAIGLKGPAPGGLM